MQNTSHAVMAQRIEPQDSPEMTSLPHHGLHVHLWSMYWRTKTHCGKCRCLEPACGAGYMAKPLEEYFGKVIAADAYYYGYGQVRDFLAYQYRPQSADWVITNPPFRLAEEFVIRAMPIARKGVAILARSVFLESVGRYEGIFCKMPPTKLAQFVERVPMVRGRLDRKATTATGYAWLVWEKQACNVPRLDVRFSPCGKQLERNSDYPN